MAMDRCILTKMAEIKTLTTLERKPRCLASTPGKDAQCCGHPRQQQALSLKVGCTSAPSCLGIYPGEVRTYIHTKTCV